MNKWDRIKDVREKHEKPSNIDRENGELDTQYFLVQVNRLGSENLLGIISTHIKIGWILVVIVGMERSGLEIYW